MPLLVEAYRALTASKNGPSLYDLCDPLLRGDGSGNPHLRKFYNTALGNPALRPLLSRAGLPELKEPAQFEALRAAIIAARDEDAPDWSAIGRTLAPLIDALPLTTPQRGPAAPTGAPVTSAGIDSVIRACARDLLGSYRRNRGFIPAYAAFNLIGDPDFHGRDLVTALQGLDARSYKNSTLLFNLARIFIGGSPAAGVINPPWRGLAEPMWSPVQIRHRSAYYDAFYAEALMDYLGSGLANPRDSEITRGVVERLVRFCLEESRERVPGPGGAPFDVVTAIAPSPHARFTRFFANIKSDLGFGLYVPDCDTTACSVSAATQFGFQDAMLDQPLIDFYPKYQVGTGQNREMVSVPLNDHVDYEGGIVTWIENMTGDRPYGNDLDPTLNLDVLEVCFRNWDRWRIGEPQRLATVQRIVRFQRRLVESGAFADPRSHIYYLPELYCAYFGRCYAAFRALPQPVQHQIDPDGSFELIRAAVLAYVRDDLLAAEINPFDAALALLALAKLGAEPASFQPALSSLMRSFGEGSFGRPYKAYEWNKMKTPTRILVGGPEVTSAFVMSALVHARQAMAADGH